MACKLQLSVINARSTINVLPLFQLEPYVCFQVWPELFEMYQKTGLLPLANVAAKVGCPPLLTKVIENTEVGSRPISAFRTKFSEWQL